MCAFRDDGRRQRDWTEAGTDAGSGAPESGRERYLGRLRRVSLVLLRLSDWGVVRSRRRPQVHLRSGPREEIAGRPLDPLDPALLDALRCADVCRA